MILRDIESEVIAPGPNGFICPQYDHYCFCNIPSLARYLLGASGSSPLSDISARAGISPPDTGAVIAFMIDGFGYNQWLEYADKYDFLKRFTANGVVAPITSVFPSTTAASVTSIHSGLTPQEHGLPEWWVYFEEIGRIIVTLPFMSLGGNTQDELLQSGVDPAMLFDGDTLYRALGDEGVRSFAFMHKNIANSSYSSRVLTGSQVVAFHDLRDLATRLTSVVAGASTPAYFHVYWGGIDSAAHQHGVGSEAYLVELDKFFSVLTRDFIDRLPGSVAREAVVLVMADHGEINVEPPATVYLNEFPELVDGLRRGRDGEKILPWGSARDVFIATEPDRTDGVLTFLSEALEGKAAVLRSEDGLQQGLFGRGHVHKEFRSRIGDILVLPTGNLTLWYERPFEKRFTLRGMHGGLSADEAIVPLALARISNLR